MDIKGHTVHRVMIAAGAKIAQEFYFSVLLDRSNRSYLAMASVEGGMEIEVLAVERPEALAKIEVDPNVGIDLAKATEIADAAGFAPEIKDQIVDAFIKLWDVYQAEDATLVEVNPLVLTEDGKIVALDVKEGDRVLFGKWSGTEVKLNGQDLLIMKESDIMGVIA